MSEYQKQPCLCGFYNVYRYGLTDDDNKKHTWWGCWKGRDAI